MNPDNTKNAEDGFQQVRRVSIVQNNCLLCN